MTYTHEELKRSNDDALKRFLAQRNEALRTLDESFLAMTMPQVKPEMRLLILHKARYETTTIDAKLRHESRAWLAERGFGRMTGAPLLPEGELPE